MIQLPLHGFVPVEAQGLILQAFYYKIKNEAVIYPANDRYPIKIKRRNNIDQTKNHREIGKERHFVIAIEHLPQHLKECLPVVEKQRSLTQVSGSFHSGKFRHHKHSLFQ